MKQGYVPGLTGMRGVAALYVLVYHLAVVGYLIDVPVVSSLQQAGWSGVSFFFVLSGYLLYQLHEDGLGRAYLARRVFRTFPLYYLCLPLYAIVGLIVLSPAYLVYAQEYLPSTFSNVPLWTLTLEELFYFVLLPLVIWTRPNRSLLLAVSIALCLLWGLVAPPTDFGTKQIPAWFVDYAIGIWLVGKRVPRRLAIPFSGAILLGGGLFYAGHDLWPFAPLVFGGGYGLLIVGFRDSKLFTNTVSVTLGKISYGVYLLQYPLLILAGPITGVAATVGLAFVSYYGFESKLVNYARGRFGSNSPREPPLYPEK